MGERLAVTISAPPELLDRIDELVKKVQHKKALGRITRSSFIRSALERGIESIEKELEAE